MPFPHLGLHYSDIAQTHLQTVVQSKAQAKHDSDFDRRFQVSLFPHYRPTIQSRPVVKSVGSWNTASLEDARNPPS
jgi:hypothetical protein